MLDDRDRETLALPQRAEPSGVSADIRGEALGQDVAIPAGLA